MWYTFGREFAAKNVEEHWSTARRTTVKLKVLLRTGRDQTKFNHLLSWVPCTKDCVRQRSGCSDITKSNDAILLAYSVYSCNCNSIPLFPASDYVHLLLTLVSHLQLILYGCFHVFLNSTILTQFIFIIYVNTSRLISSKLLTSCPHHFLLSSILIVYV